MFRAACIVALLFDHWPNVQGAAVVVNCPTGWHYWPDHCYYFSVTAKSLTEAQGACNGMSAHLVSVHSEAENDFVRSSMGVLSYDHWLGMQRNTSEEGTIAFKREDWHWLDGTSFDFYYWADTQPDTNAACAVVAKRTGFWDDRYCGKHYRFICKKEPTLPMPTSETTETGTTTVGGSTGAKLTATVNSAPTAATLNSESTMMSKIINETTTPSSIPYNKVSNTVETLTKIMPTRTKQWQTTTSTPMTTAATQTVSTHSTTTSATSLTPIAIAITSDPTSMNTAFTETPTAIPTTDTTTATRTNIHETSTITSSSSSTTVVVTSDGTTIKRTLNSITSTINPPATIRTTTNRDRTQGIRISSTGITSELTESLATNRQRLLVDSTTENTQHYTSSIADSTSERILNGTSGLVEDEDAASANLGLYLGVAAGCISVVIAVVAAGIVIRRRVRSRSENLDMLFKPYPASDDDYGNTNGDASSPTLLSAPDSHDTATGSSNTSRNPAQTDDMRTFKLEPTSHCQTFDATPHSAAILTNELDQRHSPEADDKDIGYLNLPERKRVNIFEANPIDETDTRLEHDLSRVEGYDMEDIVLSDEVTFVRNEVYDQSSFTC